MGGQVWKRDAGSETSAKHKTSQSEPGGGSAFSQPATDLLCPSTDSILPPTPAMASVHWPQYGKRKQTPLKPIHCSALRTDIE